MLRINHEVAVSPAVALEVEVNVCRNELFVVGEAVEADAE